VHASVHTKPFLSNKLVDARYRIRGRRLKPIHQNSVLYTHDDRVALALLAYQVFKGDAPEAKWRIGSAPSVLNSGARPGIQLWGC
jgi:hypothetical protein